MESEFKHEKAEQEDIVDYRLYFQSIIEIWYIFPISIILFFFMGYLYNARSPKLYKANTTVLIRQDIKTQNGSAEEVVNGFGLFDTQKKIENEIGIITSYSIAEATMQNTNHFITYYKLKKLRKDNIYTDSPFFVVIDSTQNQLSGLYKVKFYPDNSISINREEGKGVYFNFLNVNTIDLEDPNKLVSFKTNFDEWTKNKDLKVKIIKNPNYRSFNNIDHEVYYFLLRDLGSLSNSLKNAVSAEPLDRKADIIKVSLTYDNPKEATDILNSLVIQYFIDNLNEKNQKASMAIKFIDEQLDVLSDSLYSNEDKLEKFRKDNKVVNVEIQSNNLFQNIQKYESLKAISQLKLKYFDYLKNYINSSSSYSDILVPSNLEINDPLLNKLISDLLFANSEKNKILSNSTSKNPLLKNINKQVDDIKLSINESVNSLINTTAIELKDINQQLLLSDQKLLLIPENERSLINIQRSFKINNDIYTFLLQKRAESSIAQASTMPDGKFIDIARLSSTKQIKPDKEPILILFSFIGFLIPLFYIILKKKLFSFIESKIDIERKTKIPIIGKIPHSDHETNYVIFEHPQSYVSESIRSIRTSLKFILKRDSSNIIMVTSSIPKEGKTFTCVNLASSFALSNKKTIILGLDLRNPDLFKEVKLNNQKGISTYLTGQSNLTESIVDTQIPNLDLMIAGPIPPNPSELIGSDKMKELLTQLSQLYDYVIIDTPPINYVSDAIQLFPNVDAVVYIVRYKFTRSMSLENINNLHILNKVKNIGIIFNGVNKKINDYGYNYGYSYEYGYSDTKISKTKQISNRISYFFRWNTKK